MRIARLIFQMQQSMKQTSPVPIGPRLEVKFCSNEGVKEDHTIPRPILIELPLQYRWSFYFLKNEPNRSWSNNMVYINTVSSVEQFWTLMNRLRPLFTIPYNLDFMFFKADTKPMWEDERNRNGGRWIGIFEKHGRSTDIDTIWLHLLMNLAGDQFGEDGDYISGAVMSMRRNSYKLSLWTFDCQNTPVQRRLGKMFKRFLCLTATTTVCYEAHGFSDDRQTSKEFPSGASNRRKDVNYMYKE